VNAFDRAKAFTLLKMPEMNPFMILLYYFLNAFEGERLRRMEGVQGVHLHAFSGAPHNLCVIPPLAGGGIMEET
jgi:hypothetical protein